MITVKLLGGARKALATDAVAIDAESATVGSILDMLAQRTSGALGASNVLVAVNGVDSSAVGGRGAVVRPGDDVAVIPVVHGGGGNRPAGGGGGAGEGGRQQARPLMSQAARGRGRRGALIEAYVVGAVGKGGGGGGAASLDALRAEFPRASLQAVAGRFVLGGSHLRRVAAVSAEAERRRIMVAKRIETDMLARLAGTAQISAAIDAAGMGSVRRGPYVIIAIAPARRLAELRAGLGRTARPGALPASRARFLARHFGITARQRSAVAGSADPLEDILVERAAALAAG